MSARGLVIRPDGSHEFRDIASAADIRDAVGGDFDWGTPTSLMFYCYGFALYEQAINPVATELYHQVNPDAARLGHKMAGDVLVTGPPVNSEETDIPEEYVKLFHKLRQRMGQMEIARRAVPLPADEVTRLKADQDQLWAGVHEQLVKGGAVDVGGLIIGPAIPKEEE